MPNLISALLCLSLLAVLSFGCNKDTASMNSGNDAFLAPATAPDLPRQASVEEGIVREKKVEQEPIDVESAEMVELTPEERAAAKRMGPGRLAPLPATKSDAAPKTAGTKPASTGATSATAPGNERKPALDYDRTLLAMSKTACYGDCRQFSLELTNDRRLVLDARRNMDRKGLYSRRLSATEYNALKRAMEASEPAELGPLYPADAKMIPADAQATVLRYADVFGEERKVEVYYDAPERLAKFIADLESWVDKDGWIKVAE